MKWGPGWGDRSHHQVSAVVMALPEEVPEHPCLIMFIKVQVHHLLVEVVRLDHPVHQLPVAAHHHLLKVVRVSRRLEQLA
jgi:hypothetical protein